MRPATGQHNEVRPLPAANELLDRPAALRERAAREGFLFFRGLVTPEALERVRRDILRVCSRHGFLDDRQPAEQGRARPGMVLREPDPGYAAAYDDIQRLESFHALAHHSALLAMFEQLFGEPVLVHPRNIARVMFPGDREHTTPPHQDYVHIQGTAETYTVWIPLSDCPVELGNLEVLGGSHRYGVLPVHTAAGAGGLGVETDHLGLDWYGDDLTCGDVLVFQSLCVHRATPNRTPDRLRLSVDYRYQGISQPVVQGSLEPHFNRLSWDEIYTDWSDSSLQYYWRELPLRVIEWSPRYHETARPVQPAQG